MDPSALIFVALAVAWAVYLVPKALKQHDEAVRSRSVERFSHTMRVLARREPVDARNARLVVTPGRPASRAVVATKGAIRSVGEAVTETVTTTVTRSTDRSATPSPAPAPAAPPAEPTPAQLRTRREAANRAARRRRRVLGLLLLANIVVGVLAAFAVIGWVWQAVPGGLLVAWLVACRLMVRQERAVTTRVRRTERTEVVEDAPVAGEASAPEEAYAAAADQPLPVEAEAEVDWMVDTSSMPAAVIDPTLWDPVPVTLPTYVSKPAAARRSVRTIDLDSTGVWTSGNTDADSRLAREAEEADSARRAAPDEGQRAVGS